MFARGHAFIAGFDTTFVLFMWHNFSFPFVVLFVSVSANDVFANSFLATGRLARVRVSPTAAARLFRGLHTGGRG